MCCMSPWGDRDRPAGDKNMPTSKHEKSYEAKSNRPQDPKAQRRLLAIKEAYKINILFLNTCSHVLLVNGNILYWSLKKRINIFLASGLKQLVANPTGEEGMQKVTPPPLCPIDFTRSGLQEINSTGPSLSEETQVWPLRRRRMASIPFLFSPTGLCGRYSHRCNIW